jgi:hypothetical protein
MKMAIVILLWLLIPLKSALPQFSNGLKFIAEPRPVYNFEKNNSYGFINGKIKYGEFVDPRLIPESIDLALPGFGIEVRSIYGDSLAECSSLVYLGTYQYMGEKGEKNIWGEGNITRDAVDTSIYSGFFNLRWNYFDFKIGPLGPGKYILKLVNREFKSIPSSVSVDNIKYRYFDPNNIVTQITETRTIEIDSCNDDYKSITNIFFAPESEGATIMCGGALVCDKAYNLIAYLKTLKVVDAPPESLIASISFLHSGTNSRILYRWRDGELPVCDPNGTRQYAYRAKNGITPFDELKLPEEYWKGMAETITCSLQTAIGGIGLLSTGTFFAVKGVFLDNLSNSGVFIPAAGQKMAFRCLYNPGPDINAKAQVIFNVGTRDKIIYKERLFIDDPGLGFIDNFPLGKLQLNSLFVSWDGRDNQTERKGHLVDPEVGPLGSWIVINKGDEVKSQK